MAKTARHSHGREVAIVRRGDIFLVSFDPTLGREIKKTRPALVIQNDIGNRYSPVTIVAAITSKVSTTPYPVEVTIEPTQASGLGVPSAIRLDRIRTIDRQRLIKRLGTVDSDILSRVDEAIKISLGLVEI